MWWDCSDCGLWVITSCTLVGNYPWFIFYGQAARMVAQTLERGKGIEPVKGNNGYR
jgi:hypothetical protein